MAGDDDYILVNGQDDCVTINLQDPPPTFGAVTARDSEPSPRPSPPAQIQTTAPPPPVAHPRTPPGPDHSVHPSPPLPPLPANVNAEPLTSRVIGRIADQAWRGIQRFAPFQIEGDGEIVRCIPYPAMEQPLSNVGANVPVAPSVRWHDLRVGGDGDRRRATLELDLNTNDEALFVLTRGGASKGLVTLVESSTDRAKARVEVEYSFPHGHNALTSPLWQVCELRDRISGRGTGLGVYMLHGYGSLSWLWRGVDLGYTKVNVTLYIPPTVKRIATDTANFAHNLRLGERLGLEKITVRGSNTEVIAETAVATHIDIHTSNARIEGSYCASDALTLSTGNDAVLANITLGTAKTESSSGTRQPTLALETHNAVLRSTVRLVGSSTTRFNARLNTSNDALDVAILTLPPDAALSVSARSANGRAHLTLPATFEGTIDQSTSNSGRPKLVVNRDRLKDPKGQERTYVVENHSQLFQDERKDRVMWGHKGGRKGAGSVELETSNDRCGVEISPAWE